MQLRASSWWSPLLLAVAIAACNGAPAPREPRSPDPSAVQAPTGADPQEGAKQRIQRMAMVSDQIEERGIESPRVLAAMRAVPRHRFVPDHLRDSAYEDRPLPIEAGQTISQPYIVALMSELADIEAGDRVLEVGTGSGYQAAVLAQMGAKVYSIEIVEELAKSADKLLQELGYAATVKHGDGYAGWPEHAPFEAIVVTAAPPEIPEPLKQQLAPGGRLVVPVGRGYQELLVLTRTDTGYQRRSVIPVRFVPMTGEAQK